MTAVETLEILGQIQVLATDKLQVVSYKWLSRNLSVSSNHAKRLLQEFVNKHGDEVEVVYSLSGWLKNNQTYCTQLTSGQKLEEARKEFDGNCAVHVYSIQACIPDDLAVLWNAEFIQAEELFGQPANVENCLRDNRFSGISNTCVRRTVDAKLSATSSNSLLKDSIGANMQGKVNSCQKDEFFQPQQGKLSHLGAKDGQKFLNVLGSAKNVNDHATKPQLAEESTSLLHTKRGIQNEKTLSGTDGSLATLWGRASETSKPSSLAGHALDSADGQICMQEAANTPSSDDDDYSVPHKRASNGSGARKRQFIFDFSDEDDQEEKVVSLASPDPPNAKILPVSLQTTNSLKMDKEIFNFEEQKTDASMSKQENAEKKSHGSSLENSITADFFWTKTENGNNNEIFSTDKKDNAMSCASASSKRKKLLKTRIDERGREVTEVVWEESACAKSADKDRSTDDAGNSAAMTNKAREAGSNLLAKIGTKAVTKKPGKGGGKDTKQGNILSFFKKM